MADEAQVARQVEKILSSPLLQGSDALCKLLRHLAENSVGEQKAPTSEFRIGIEVLGRRADFNPKVDSAVRVQTSRLRSKLAEYYATIGAADEIIIDIPKRGFSLAIQERTPAVAAAPPARRHWLAWALAALVLGGLAAIQTFRYQQLAGSVASGLSIYGMAPEDLRILRRFWAPFLRNPQGPLIVFSNGEFSGSPIQGMRLLLPGEPRVNIIGSYTGVGEVLAVHALDRVFAAVRVPTRVKRGGLLTFDDAQANDIVFVGSPAENTPLQDLPLNREFVFQRKANNGYEAIRNLHPQSGEPALYVSDSANPPSRDYAVVASTEWKRHAVLSVAGTTTFGTEAAADFVSNPDSIRELLERRGARDGAPFEAVLEVQLKSGVPLATRVVALHLIQSH